MKRVFVLDLDEPLRLAGEPPAGKARRDAMARARAHLAASLVPPGASVVRLEDAPDLRGAVVHAFVPSERLRRAVERRGGTLVPGPADAVLRSVLRRDFAYLSELPDAFVARAPEDALTALARADGRVRLKRVVGLSGIGHRVVTTLDAATRAFVAASRHGLVVEPEVAIAREWSIHGFVDRGGAVVSGAPCVLETSRGAFHDARRASPAELPEPRRQALEAALAEAARALHEAGYFGPFGVDAYEGQLRGEPVWRSRSEINARYTMAWAVGMGSSRPDLDLHGTVT